MLLWKIHNLTTQFFSGLFYNSVLCYILFSKSYTETPISIEQVFQMRQHILSERWDRGCRCQYFKVYLPLPRQLTWDPTESHPCSHGRSFRIRMITRMVSPELFFNWWKFLVPYLFYLLSRISTSISKQLIAQQVQRKTMAEQNFDRWTVQLEPVRTGNPFRGSKGKYML